MLFIMLNEEYPFDRKAGKDEMYQKQMTRDFHLSEEVDGRSTDLVKDLLNFMLEPDAKKRPDIFKVCQHPWFPIVLRENEILGQVAPGSTGSATALVPTRARSNTR